MDTNASAASVGLEKRVDNRVRSFLRAQIIFNNRMTTIDCIIKNISPSGARVALTDTVTVPSEFDIFIPQRNALHHARLTWRDKDLIGVDFLDTSLQPQAASAQQLIPEVTMGGSEARIRELEAQNAELKIRIRKLNQRLEDLGQDPSNVI